MEEEVQRGRLEGYRWREVEEEVQSGCLREGTIEEKVQNGRPQG